MQNNTAKTRRLVQLSLLLALEIIMAFTPLGFVMIPPISITLMHIPVIIGGILLGKTSGAMLGGAFGVLSIIRSISSPVPADIAFNPAASGNPIGSLVMAILPRILLGFLAAVVFDLLRTRCKRTVALGFSAAAASVAHSFGVLFLLSTLFDALPIKEVFLLIISVNGLVELGAAIVICTAVCSGVLAAQGNKK